MVHFYRHEVNEEKNDYVEVVLFLNPAEFTTEFAGELGTSPEKTLNAAALSYVRRHLPQVRFKQIKVMLGGLLVATILGTSLSLGAGQASAASTNVGVTGTPLAVGELTVGSFAAVILNGRTQSTFANVNSFTVEDPTGTGAGWRVTMKATPFTNAAGDTLPTGSLSVTAPSVAKIDAGSSDLTTITPSGGTLDTDLGTVILNAAGGGGMGSYTVAFGADALNLNLLPKYVKSGTYNSTITVTIQSGPA